MAGGLATAPAALIAARSLQGVGAAILSPATLTLLATTFRDPAGRTRAVALWSAAGASAGAIGSALGGLLTEYLSWRWVLLINVPIGLIVFVAALRLLTEEAGRAAQRLDIAGAILSPQGSVPSPTAPRRPTSTGGAPSRRWVRWSAVWPPSCCSCWSKPGSPAHR